MAPQSFPARNPADDSINWAELSFYTRFMTMATRGNDDNADGDVDALTAKSSKYKFPFAHECCSPQLKKQNSVALNQVRWDIMARPGAKQWGTEKNHRPLSMINHC